MSDNISCRDRLAAELVGSKLSLAYCCIFVLCSAVVVLLFPRVNWQDELRNLEILELRAYGIFYGPALIFILEFLSGFGVSGSFREVITSVAFNESWAMINGDLRYEAIGEAPMFYYAAKFANLLIVSLYSGLFLLYLRASTPRGAFGANSALYFLALSAPAVVYQVLQISTDLLFVAMSISLYFLRGRWSCIVFSAACFALILEDRSFLILAVTALGLVLAPLVFRWKGFLNRPYRRAFALFLVAAMAILLGIALKSAVRSLSILSVVSGFADIGNQLNYTQSKAFNIVISPTIMYAGLVYLPSATEFFIRTLPLYVLAAPVFIRYFRMVLTDNTDVGEKFFHMTLVVLFVFLTVVTLTHVFESGRYYFTLIPPLVVSACGLLSRRKDRAGLPGLRLAGVFSLVSVLATTTVLWTS